MPELRLGSGRTVTSSAAVPRTEAASPPWRAASLRAVPVILTLIVAAAAAVLGIAMWDAYMGSPWTRDGTVRAYVVTIAPEVTGRIVQLPVTDNQIVHKGDLLMVIDPTNYALAVSLAQAAVQQAKDVAENTRAEAKRRQELTSLSTSLEEQQTYTSKALSAEAAYQQAVANLGQARVNLDRSSIRSPVNGYVTNLLAQIGDYANAGDNKLTVVDADSYWVDGYFLETTIRRIKEGDPATVKLMGYNALISGHVASIARAINVANAKPNAAGLAEVNPIFTWVRLAQRIPVRIHIDKVPDGVLLIAGMTATVQIDPRPDRAAPDRAAPRAAK